MMYSETRTQGLAGARAVAGETGLNVDFERVNGEIKKKEMDERWVEMGRRWMIFILFEGVGVGG